MNIIKVHDILNVDTISKGNNRPWDKLITYVEENITEPTDFDFTGIEVIQPYSSDSFLKLMSMPNFYMTLRNSPKVANSIELVLVLNGQPKDKIKNIQDVVPEKVDPNKLAMQKMAVELQEYFETVGNVGKLHIYRRFNQIGSNRTVDYIREAMKLYHKNTGISNIVLYMSNITIQAGLTEYVTKLADDMHEIGVHLDIVTDDADLKVKISMYNGLRSANYTLIDKFDIMKARLAIGRVGILTKYKEGRARDEFGRYGKGEKVQVRVSVFRGFFKKDNNIYAKFETFNGNTFYPASHWQLTHDGEIMGDLHGDMVDVAIADLGIYNDFIGSRYHFSTPVQYSDVGTEIIYRADENGKVTGTKMTIPERIKDVFEDHLIKYEHESLDAYIEETKKILNKD